MQVTPEEYRRLTGREPPVARPDLEYLRAETDTQLSGGDDASAKSDNNDTSKTGAKGYDEDWLPEGIKARPKAESIAK